MAKQIANVPVEFWGYTYPHGTFQVRYNPKTQWWTFTVESAFRGHTPYCKWIEETFSPRTGWKVKDEIFIRLVTELVFEGDVPVKFVYKLEEWTTYPPELKKRMDEWKYWMNEPEPDTSAYHRLMDMDKEEWQKENALITCRKE